MSDIVEKLRLLVPSDSTGASIDAADEITRLRARVARLEEALQAVDDEHGYVLPPETRNMIRAALAKTGESNDR